MPSATTLLSFYDVQCESEADIGTEGCAVRSTCLVFMAVHAAAAAHPPMSYFASASKPDLIHVQGYRGLYDLDAHQKLQEIWRLWNQLCTGEMRFINVWRHFWFTICTLDW